MDPLLAVRGLGKTFGGVAVLDDVSFEVQPGEVLGLIGENGAGKSTLLKILCGIYQPSSGGLEFDGRPVEIRDPLAAKKLGIGLVPQEFNLVNTLSVSENIWLGNELRRGPFLAKAPMRRRAQEYLDRLGTSVRVDELVEGLSVAGKQMVEVAKALVHQARLLILDEPTTALTGHEVETLFRLVNELRDQGVTLVFVSHKLHEIRALCDRVVVLRDGRLVAVAQTKHVNEDALARQMVGRELSQVFPPKRPVPEGPPVLAVTNLRRKGQEAGATFTLRRGEILGFAGLVGSGRTELAEALLGLRPATGRVEVEGRPVRIGSPRDAVRHRLGYLSEDRQGKGIVGTFDVPQNLTLISLKKYAPFFIDHDRERAVAADYVKTFAIAASSLTMELRYFSGGNQQKVYLARWMDTDPLVLILDEPTRGIDINAKAEIYRFVHDLAARGVSCVVISSELEEVIGLCSRVYVMHEGQIAACLEGDAVTQENIMLSATGLRKENS